MQIAIRYEAAQGPVVLAVERRDYPASFELPAIIRKQARRLGAEPAGALEPVAFLNFEVGSPEELLKVDPGQAKVLCAKLGAGGSSGAAPGGTVLLGPPSKPS